MKDLKNILKGKIIEILIIIVVLLFILYLVCPTLRDYIFEQKIEANFVLGFLTVITLMVSIWQNTKDRKLTYNINVWESVRNNGLAIISKLIAIKQKSDIIVKTLKSHQDAIKKRQVFMDSNDTLSKRDIDDGFQIVAAYADTYFRDECEKWNEMLNKLSAMATDNINVIKNYEINLQLIMSGTDFRNSTLDKLDEIVANAEKADKEIAQITEEMRNKIIGKTNSISDKIKNNL
ncbi:MAG: hypothetical protein V4467_02395 [Patescibacteria group bacterium]